MDRDEDAHRTALQAIAGGTSAADDAWRVFAPYAESIVGRTLKRLWPRLHGDAIEEIVSLTLLKLLTAGRAAQIPVEPEGATRAYIAMAAQRAAVDRFRGVERMETVDLAARERARRGTRPHQDVQRAERIARELFERALGRGLAHEVFLVRLALEWNLSYAEIACVLGNGDSADLVRKHVAAAIERIRDLAESDL